MYRVDRNNYIENCKNSDIETPTFISRYIFNILRDKFNKKDIILDPCCGVGWLLHVWHQWGCKAYGIEVNEALVKEGNSYNFNIYHYDYLTEDIRGFIEPELVIMNPPFNLTNENKENSKKYCKNRPLMSEIFLQRTIELFGKYISMVLFAPYGLRLNQTIKSKRWNRFIDGTYPEISSIISLPKNAFKGVLFHSEILIFNISGLKPHYFIDNNYLI